MSGSWNYPGPKMPESAFFDAKGPIAGDKRYWGPLAARFPLLAALVISLALVIANAVVAAPDAVLEAALAADTGITSPESVYTRRQGFDYAVTLIGPYLSIARETATVRVNRAGEVVSVHRTIGDPRAAHRTLLWLGVAGVPASLAGLYVQWRLDRARCNRRFHSSQVERADRRV